MSDDVLVKILEKLDEIKEDINEVKITQVRHEENLIRNDENLKTHMKRSDLLEDSQKILFKEVTEIKLHSSQLSGIFKALGILSTLVTFILGVLKLIGKI